MLSVYHGVWCVVCVMWCVLVCVCRVSVVRGAQVWQRRVFVVVCRRGYWCVLLVVEKKSIGC